MIDDQGGFKVARKASQAPATLLNMRLGFAILPTVLLVPALGLL